MHFCDKKFSHLETKWLNGAKKSKYHLLKFHNIGYFVVSVRGVLLPPPTQMKTSSKFVIIVGIF